MTDQNQSPQAVAALRQAALALQRMQSQLESVEKKRNEPIAIIGMACRFPGGADDPETYWQLLRCGTDLVGDIPATRWNLTDLYDPDPDVAGRIYCKQGGFLKDIEQFDPAFFGISAREAMSMDPQQRLALEVTWEALENAAIAPRSLMGTNTGVFLGICAYGYGLHTIFSGVPERIDPYCGTGIALDVAAGRISYTLGLQGPNMPVDTACSSSLVAPHLAMQSLRSGQCDLALAGGVNLLVAPEMTVYFCKLRALSKAGRCRTFDASADGYVRGEGCGMLVLKRLSDAIADRDRIVGVLRGSAINHDGRSGGLTVPNGRSQQMVIRRALADAKLSPADIDYIEAHGTGTPLGDPIEIHALAELFGQEREPGRPLLIGSVKTNIGHLEAAAGVAGIMKVALALNREELPPHLHFTNWNPHINLNGTPFRVTTECTPWRKGEKVRLAGISSFGISGTNAHVILEEAPAVAGERRNGTGKHLNLLALSARTAPMLDEVAARYERRLSTEPPRAEDAAFTANTGRTHFNHRLAIIASDVDGMRSALATPERQERLARSDSDDEPGARPLIGFLFSGQGSQYPGMARKLYETRPSFRQTLQRCDDILASQLGKSLLPLILGEAADAESLLDQTRYTQPALFALEYSLAELWRSWGVLPDAVMGHSVGELAAACIAGVFNLEEGLKFSALRGRLMSALPPGGAMAAIRTGLAEVQEALKASGVRVSIAGINGPQQVVVSGAGSDVETLMEQLRCAGVQSQRLNVSHAFHSDLMDPALDDLEHAAGALRCSNPAIRMVSNLTGAFVLPGQIGPRYWREHARQPVRFAAGMRALADFGCGVLIEIGPSPALSALGQSCLPDRKMTWLASLRRGKDDLLQVLETLAEVYIRGVDIDWARYHLDAPGEKVEMPASPFQRDRFWIPRAHSLGSPGENSAAVGESHPLLGSRLQLAGSEIVYQARIDPAKPSFLSDHQVHGIVVFPAAGYCEMALAAAAARNGGPTRITTLAVEEPLVLTENGKTTVQSVLRQGKDRPLQLEIFSLGGNPSGDEASWRRHAVATLEPCEWKQPEPLRIADLRRQCINAIPVESHYAAMREHGMKYGPAFQGIQELYAGDGQSLARIVLPPGARARNGEAYRLHPALLDACLQSMGAAVVVDAGVSYLPVVIGGLELHAPIPGSIWCHATTVEAGAPGSLVADFRLMDDNGSVLANINGVRFRRATREAILGSMQPANEAWVHEIQWRRVESPAEAQDGDHGAFLIFGGRGGTGSRVAELLNARGQNAVVAAEHAGDSPNIDDFEGLLADLAGGSSTPRRIVYVADDDLPGSGSPGFACTTLLALVQALIRSRVEKQRLWIVTRRAQAVLPEGEPVSPAAAALWGMGRVIAGEHPELRCALVDLNPTSSTGEDELIEHLLSPGDEDQVAFRSGLRYAARLVRRTSPGAGRLAVPEGTQFQLKPGAGGVLDALHLAPVALRDPGPGEVRIRVHATGLNFRDVLNVLGMYPGDAGPLGGECAGEVIAADPATGFQPGQRVLAVAPASFASEVVIPAYLAISIPSNLSFEEAATLPVAFLTADYALNHLGKMRRGEKVLIHSAAGGVGHAAIQLAALAGAEVFATAGSEEKRERLRSLGVRHVMDSRSLAFQGEVLEATAGRGVDLVLNALAGEFISASLALLARGGRFLEIGKAEVWSEERVTAANPGVSYFPVALDTLSVENPALIQEMMRTLISRIEAGVLHPLPLRTYSIADCIQAFRFMQRARHIGKIVITQHADAGALRQDATYMITGGMGALGLQVSRHFAARGARALAVVARSQPSDAALAVFEDLRGQGVNVSILRCDVSRQSELAAALDSIRDSMPPLRGIVHAAGVLDDGALMRQTAPQFERVFAPKAAGAWNLHMLTQAMPLDFFVLFSSAAGVLGSPGQLNYAAANAYLDGLCDYRRSQGLPATSIDWGPWRGPGMASGEQGPQRDWSSLGIRPIEPRDGLALLDEVIAAGCAQIIAIPVQWSTFLAQLPARSAPPPLLRELNAKASRQQVASGNREDLLTRLKGAPETEHLRITQNEIERHVKAILGSDSAARIDPHEPLHDLGFDSLMAVELRNALSNYVMEDLPATLAFDYPTLESLAEYLLDELLQGETQARAQATGQ